MTRTGETNSNAVFCRGDSMRPLFRPGDRIVFVPCRVEELKRGDVIIFLPPGKQERVVHRVVFKGHESVRTQGDASPSRDAGEAAASAGICGESVMKGACVESCSA
jgi:signal peptidase I